MKRPLSLPNSSTKPGRKAIFMYGRLGSVIILGLFFGGNSIHFHRVSADVESPANYSKTSARASSIKLQRSGSSTPTIFTANTDPRAR